MSLAGEIETVEAFLTRRRLAPASVQRTYQWGVEHTDALLGDLLRTWRQGGRAEILESEIDAAEGEGEGGAGTPEAAAGEASFPDLGLARRDTAATSLRPFFLGPVVIAPAGDADGVFQVYDGLQRSTALTILLAVLRDLVLRIDPALSERLHRCIETAAGEGVVDPGRTADTLRSHIRPRGEAVRRRRNYIESKTVHGRILASAASFRKTLADELEEVELASFAEYVLTHAFVCTLTVAEAGLGRQIFLTTNNRGLRLNQADVFKGQIHAAARTAEGAEEVLRVWSAVDAEFDDKEAFVDFLSAVDVLERDAWPGPEGLTDLGDFLIARAAEIDVIGWVKRIRRWGRAWRELYTVRRPGAVDPFAGDTVRLHLVEWPEWRPLALMLYDRWIELRRTAEVEWTKAQKAAHTTLNAQFDRLHRRCMAMTLAGFSERTRRGLFLKALSRMRRRVNPLSDAGPLTLTPEQKSRARQALAEPLFEEKLHRPLLRWYEAMQWGPNPPAWVLALTTEHILPRAPPSGSDWFERFPDEDSRRRLTHSPGNLALLSWNDNSRAGNDEFQLKRDVYRTPEWPARVLEEPAAAADWTPAMIEARSRRIVAFVTRELDLGGPEEAAGGAG